MKCLHYVLSVGSAVLVAVSATAASAQFRDAGSKIRGEAMAGHEARTYQRHAQERSQVLYYHYYNQPQPAISKADAKEMVGTIRRDLTASDKALAKLKAAHAKEPEVVKLIESIEKHHAKAHEVCHMTEAECTKEHGDHVVCANCCSQMWHELDAAKLETQKLLKMLKIETLEPPKKVEAKTDAPATVEKK